MFEHTAIIRWSRSGPDFLKGKYSREHTWAFDGGLAVAASSSPHVVPTPWSNPANVDPEEAFVAVVSSCHMLTFVWLASREGFTLESYEDHAIGRMSKNERGVQWISSVALRPRLTWSGDKRPTAADLDRLHHRAHEGCFIEIGRAHV
jgi:organic hydroperoxide reductase OsmC/OhrA